ncbi:MAG: hypothetical protein Q8Q02_00200 [Nocardioides sp.]|nr:hypothetical protein [Nocardioides sp.]
MEALDRTAQRVGAFGRMRYVTPVRYRESTGTHRAIYDQILAEYGLGGPFFVTSVSTPLLAATWGLVRASVASGPLPRGLSEVIASAVAQTETCPFCVGVHSELAGAGGEQTTASLIAQSKWERLADRHSESDQLALWARNFVRGDTIAPPVPDAHAPYAVSVALTFVHVTTMVTIFQADGMVAGAGGSRVVDAMVKHYMRHSLGKRMVARTATADATAGPDPVSGPSSDFAFAATEPSLTQAWAMFDHAVGSIGNEVLSGRARKAVNAVIDQRIWDEPSLDLRFIDEAVASIPESEVGAARLALMAGTAPYRVTRADIDVAGPGGQRGERWVALAALGAAARIRALAENSVGEGGRRQPPH